MQQRVDERVLFVTGAGMNNQAVRLVDDNEIVVFEKDVERDRFRLIVDLLRRGFGQFDFVAAAHEIARPRRGAIASHESAPDQLLQPGARILAHLAGKKPIQAKTGRATRNGELDRCHWFVWIQWAASSLRWRTVLQSSPCPGPGEGR